MIQFQKALLLPLIPTSLGIWLLWFAPESVLGLDSGILGSVVMSFSAWSAILLLAESPLTAPESLSPSERQAWVGLAFTTMIYVYFLTHLGVLGAEEGAFWNPEARRVGQTIAIMVIAWIVLSSMIRQKARGVQKDERDRDIETKAESLGHGVLIVGLIGTAVTLGLSPREHLEWADPRMTANIILNLLVLKTLIEQNALVVMHWWDRR
jgi:hypothetical protein